jgi:hypothetical protein
MHRTTGVVALLVALVLTGCGGTDWNTAKTSAVKSARQAAAAKTPAAKAAEAKAEHPLIAAMVANAKANDPSRTVAAGAVDRCFATAIVEGYGAATFRAHRMTAARLRNPKSTLDALPNPTAQQVTAIGASLQRCNVRALAKVIEVDFSITNQAAAACVAGHLGTGPDAHPFLVVAALGRKMTLAAAHAEVDVASSCVDLAGLVLRGVTVKADAATRACIVNVVRGASDALADYFALKLTDTNPAAARGALESVTVAMNRCGPGADHAAAVSG